MTENERKAMMVLADTIEGEINRMCVTKELAEFDVMYGHAKRNLDRLSEMIYGARFVAEIEPQESIVNKSQSLVKDLVKESEVQHDTISVRQNDS